MRTTHLLSLLLAVVLLGGLAWFHVNVTAPAIRTMHEILQP